MKVLGTVLLCAAMLTAALSSSWGVQLLTNGNLDTAVGAYVANATVFSSGWNLTSESSHGASFNQESLFVSYPTWGIPCNFHTPLVQALTSAQLPAGHDALRMRAEYGTPSACPAYAWQEIAANANAPYTASVWVYVPGVDDTDYAELMIEEKNSSGTVIKTYDHITDPSMKTTIKGSWVQLQKAFTTQSTTSTIRFKMFGYVNHYYHSVVCWIVWDDAVLDGAPKGYDFTVSGTVTSEGTPVGGATVTAGADTTTTLSNGTYTMSLHRDSLQGIHVVASKTGYLPQPKWFNAVSGANTVNLDILAVPANNLLVNGDFEPAVSVAVTAEQTGSQNGWAYHYYAGGASYTVTDSEVAMGQGYPQWGPTSVRSGTDAMRFRSHGTGGRIILAQDIPVATSHLYKSSVWFFGYSTGAGFGSSPNDYAKLRVEEYTGSGTFIIAHEATSTQSNQWVKLAQNFTTATNTGYVRFIVDSKLEEVYYQAPAHVTFDSAILDGPSLAVSFNGTVTSGATPLANAKVEAGGQTIYTGADGKYNVTINGALQVNFRVSLDGYYAQQARLTGSVDHATTRNFNLVAANMLTNAGFDDGGIAYWNLWRNPFNNQALSSPVIEAESKTADSGGTSYYDSGFEACHIWTYGNGDAKIYQMISVQPSNSYHASCRFRAGYDPAKINDPINPINWGLSGSSDWAKLFVEEYRADGTLISERSAPATVFDAWQTLNVDFSTSSQTAWVRIGGWANVIDYYLQDFGRAIFDSFVLTGAPGPGATAPTMPGLYGIVRDRNTGSPISGATVEVTGTSYTAATNANGVYNLKPPGGIKAVVRASKGGYFAQRKTRYPSEMLDFDLDPVGNNILVDAGFDDGYPAGVWYMDCLDITGPEGQGESLAWNLEPYYCDTGEGAVFLAWQGAGAPPRTGSVSQYASVLPNTPYSASLRFRAARNKRFVTSIWEQGIMPYYQDAWLKVEEYDAQGNIVNTAPIEVIASKVNDWETLSVGFTTSPTTVAARVIGFEDHGGDWETNNGNVFVNRTRTVFDSFALRGPKGPDFGKITDVKGLAEGSAVVLFDKPVAAGYFNLPGCCYIEEWDRSCGIRVNRYGVPGQLMTVFGTIQTIDGEKCIVPTFSQMGPDGDRRVLQPLVSPIGLNNRGLDQGLSPVGLYVTIWGKIDSVDKDNLILTLTDGSGASVKVYYEDCMFAEYAGADYTPTVNDYIEVSGGVGAENSGATRVIRAMTGAKKN